MFHIQEVLRENYICLAFDFSCNYFYIYQTVGRMYSIKREFRVLY